MSITYELLRSFAEDVATLEKLLSRFLQISTKAEKNPTTLLSVYDQIRKRNLSFEETIDAIEIVLMVLGGTDYDVDNPFHAMIFDTITTDINSLRYFVKKAIVWMGAIRYRDGEEIRWIENDIKFLSL